MLYGLLGALGVFGAYFSFFFIKDMMEFKGKMEKGTNFMLSGFMGFVANFFDTLGIGSFAPLTAMLRFGKQIEDRVIPGTLNVSCTWPVLLEAFIFISAIDMDMVTLISLIAASVVGAKIGSKWVSGFSEKRVQLVMAFALLAAAFLFIAGDQGWLAFQGEARGLTGARLAIGIVLNFIFGALMTMGVGLYAPAMAMVTFLGMSPRVAFPVMMGSCAFLMPVASAEFVKQQAYNKKASWAINLFGVIGVLIAAFIVKSLPLKILRYLVIVVIFYTSMTLFAAARKHKEMELEVQEA
ncbi:TSUP family transporter [Dethiosulfovibrio sp. F2B]|uniref:TSUP family transporter n=1 Tax=Dethiosulfovibrio faecalis TaxID=2720018 RepID=UPI001F26362E|nr:TSUP family transporter [Dethiosulfovibrio faecalis]MCF4151534.1 TSUP family transporter [Dethiosulfovibrio faecalis]